MEVHFTPEQEAQLAQLATRSGADAESMDSWQTIQREGEYDHEYVSQPS